MATQSKDLDCFILHNLLGAPNFDGGIAVDHVDRVKATNLVEMNDVPKVPAGNHVGAGHRCNRNFVDRSTLTFSILLTVVSIIQRDRAHVKLAARA